MFHPRKERSAGSNSGQRKENDFRLAKEDSIRNAYVATMMTEERAREALDQEALARFNISDEDKEKMVKILVASRGNYKTLLHFIKIASNLTEERFDFALVLLQQLSAKDWRDVSIYCLVDYLQITTSMKVPRWSTRVWKTKC